MTPQIKQRIEQIRRGEVPEGYKKTKVGIVPEEWEITKLYLISSHVSKKNTNGEVQTTFTNSATQGVIKQTDYFDKEISNKENITSYYVVQENDYIYNPRISVSAPCGPINKSHFSENGIVSPLYTVFRLNDVFQQNKYIEFFFKSSFWHSYMCGIANYGARHDRMNITNYDLFNMPIPFPPIAEQEKIAAILQTEDKVIELQQKKINELKRLKKVYLSKMFPKKDCNVPEIRFPGFTEPWEQRKLGDISEIKTGPFGSTLHADDYVSDGTPIITTEHFKTGALPRSKNGLPQVSDSDYKRLTAYTLDAGDIVFSRVGSVDINALITPFQSNWLFSGRVLRVRPQTDVSSQFLHTRLETESIKTDIRTRAVGQTMPSINTEILKITPLVLPSSVAEQEQIGTYFAALDNLITLHQRKCDEEKQKKKALMQLLLTGIVRTNK